MKHLLKSLYIKVESTYGVSAAPTSADAILAENVEIEPLLMQTDDQAPVHNQFGKQAKILGPTWCSVKFDVLVGGGGTPLGNISSVPNHDAVLRAGAMSRVITPGLYTVYSPISNGEESVTATYQVDYARFILLGIRGDLEWIFEEGKAPRLQFNGLGLRQPMQDVAPSSYALPVKPRPIAMTRNNTQFVLDGSYNLRCSSLRIKLGNKVEYINRSNQEEVILTDRESAGAVTFELPGLTAKDFMGPAGLCTLATQTALFVQFGGTAGSRTSWTLPAIQLLNPRLGGNKGTTMLTCDIHLIANQIEAAYL